MCWVNFAYRDVLSNNNKNNNYLFISRKFNISFQMRITIYLKTNNLKTSNTLRSISWPGRVRHWYVFFIFEVQNQFLLSKSVHCLLGSLSSKFILLTKLASVLSFHAPFRAMLTTRRQHNKQSGLATRSANVFLSFLSPIFFQLLSLI